MWYSIEIFHRNKKYHERRGADMPLFRMAGNRDDVRILYEKHGIERSKLRKDSSGTNL